MQRENCAVQGDEIALAMDLVKLENKYEKTIDWRCFLLTVQLRIVKLHEKRC